MYYEIKAEQLDKIIAKQKELIVKLQSMVDAGQYYDRDYHGIWVELQALERESKETPTPNIAIKTLANVYDITIDDIKAAIRNYINNKNDRKEQQEVLEFDETKAKVNDKPVCKKCGSVDINDGDFYCLQCRIYITELITKYK